MVPLYLLSHLEQSPPSFMSSLTQAGPLSGLSSAPHLLSVPQLHPKYTPQAADLAALSARELFAAEPSPRALAFAEASVPMLCPRKVSLAAYHYVPARCHRTCSRAALQVPVPSSASGSAQGSLLLSPGLLTLQRQGSGPSVQGSTWSALFQGLAHHSGLININ